MEPEREIYGLSINLGCLFRGPPGELEALLAEIKRFTHAHPDVRLVYKDVSGDPMRIERKGGRP